MTLAPETGEVLWVSMGLRRVLFLAEVLFVFVEVPGLFVWPGSHWPRDQVLRSVASRLGTSRFRDRSGWRPPCGRPPLSGSLGLAPSGTGPKHHLSARRYAMSNRPRPHDPLRQPRRLPDLYAVVARDKRGQLPVHRGRNMQLTRPLTFKLGTVPKAKHRSPASLLPSAFAPPEILGSQASSPRG
jgi:hypothetical protein